MVTDEIAGFRPSVRPVRVSRTMRITKYGSLEYDPIQIITLYDHLDCC